MLFNYIPPRLVHTIFTKLNGGMSVEDVIGWLALEHGIYVSKSSMSKYWRKERVYKYKPTGRNNIHDLELLKNREADKVKREADAYKEKLARQKEREEQRARDVLVKGKTQYDKRAKTDDVDRAIDRGYIEEENVVFRPNPGPQEEFLSASEDDVLFGGAAGPGKSLALVVDAVRYAHKSKHRALILRRTLKELRQLIDMSREYYPKAFPRAKYKEAEKVWVFPSGARIEFNYLEKDADVYQYQGQDFTWIGFDELTQLPTEFPWNYLASRLRTTDPDIQVYQRATTNPGGPGAHWVKKRYIDPAEYGKAFRIGEYTASGKPLTRRFIPASLKDNPYLYNDGRYEAMLKTLPPILRRQLLDGDWDVFDGAAFPEFDREIHVIHPFDIPYSWKRIRALDYGYSAPSACLWGAIDPSDNTIIIYRELYQKGLHPEELANRITELELNDPPMTGVVDWAVFSRTGYNNTIGQILNKSGLKLRPANKDRKAGKLQIHERLSAREGTRPHLQFFSTCTNMIRELTSIPLKDNDTEDVDTRADDHCYDKDTEILTENGWKSFSDVSIGERVPTLSQDNIISYQPVTDLISKKWSGEMFSYSSNGMNFRVTSDHTMCIVNQYNHKKLKTNSNELVPINKISSVSWIPRSGKFTSESSVNLPCEDKKAFMWFLGFWLAEGHCNSSCNREKVGVDQKDNLEIVERYLNRLPWNYVKYTNKNGITRYTFENKNLISWFKSVNLWGKHSWSKFIPRDILAYKELEYLYNGLMFGDGSTLSSTWHYDTVSERLAGDFQELLLKIGMVGNKKVYKNGLKPHHRDLFRISIRATNFSELHRKSLSIENVVNEDVFCVIVPQNHTLYVRRKGCPMWSGNCYDALRYMLMDIPRPTVNDWFAQFKKERAYSRPAVADRFAGY